jgi:hypothetical protein
MDAAVHVGSACGASDEPLHDLLRERLTGVVAQHAWAPQMAMRSKSSGEAFHHAHVSHVGLSFRNV